MKLLFVSTNLVLPGKIIWFFPLSNGSVITLNWCACSTLQNSLWHRNINKWSASIYLHLQIYHLPFLPGLPSKNYLIIVLRLPLVRQSKQVVKNGIVIRLKNRHFAKWLYTVRVQSIITAERWGDKGSSLFSIFPQLSPSVEIFGGHLSKMVKYYVCSTTWTSILQAAAASWTIIKMARAIKEK